MASRVAAGLTFASFPLIAAIPAIQDGNMTLAGVLLSLWVGMTALVFAPRLPLLHALPLVGAPKASATVDLFNGGPLEVVIAKESDQTRSVIARVQVENKTRADVRNALLTVFFPEAVEVEECSFRGEPRSVGSWLPMNQHRLGEHEWARRWVVERDVINGLRTLEMWFRVRLVKGEGEYPIAVWLDSPDLHPDLRSEEFNLRVTTAKAEADLPIVDRVSVLIDEGEEMLGAIPDVYTGSQLENRFGTWLFRCIDAIPDEYMHLWDAAKPTGRRKEVGDDFRAAQVRADLDALYDIRHFLSTGHVG